MSDDFIEGADGLDPFDPEVVADAQAKQAADENLEIHEEEAKIRAVAEAYVRVFQGNPIGDDVNTVMLDLMGFCRGGTSTYDDNDRRHARYEGRREVYQRIKDFTGLDHDTLFRLYMRALPMERD